MHASYWKDGCERRRGSSGGLVRGVVLGLTAVFLIGCSGNLTRGKAESLLRERFKFPTNETQDFTLYQDVPCGFWQQFVGIHQRPCVLDDVSTEHKALQGEGLLTVVFEGNYKRLELTEKGKQYSVGNIIEIPKNPGIMGMTLWEMHRDIKIITSTLDFGGITGITVVDGVNVASVEYTLSRKVTPFGRLAYHLEPSTFAGKPITMKEYDDGWRINQ